MTRSRWLAVAVVVSCAIALGACMPMMCSSPSGCGTCVAPPCAMTTRPSTHSGKYGGSASAKSPYVQFWGYVGRRNTAGGRTLSESSSSSDEPEIVSAPPLPAGMSGRCTECHNGSQHSRTGRKCTGCAKAASLPGGCLACHKRS